MFQSRSAEVTRRINPVQSEEPAPMGPGAAGGPERLDGAEWSPVPASYDWYGAVDPDGLVDDSDPFSGALRGRASG